MIKSYLGLVIIFAVQHQLSSLSVDLHHRMAQRNDKMKRLQDIHKRSEALQDPIDNYDLIVTVPSDTSVIKPILRNSHQQHRHRSGKDANVTIKNLNLTGETSKSIKEENTATTTKYQNENSREEEEEEGKEGKVAITQKQEHKYNVNVETSQIPVEKKQNVTHIVPFYRRVNYLDDQERNKPQKWVHCLDLVSPRLKGYKDNWRPKEVTHRHADIKRLSELLTTDVSKYTEEEIISVLFQISKLDLRIFQWDYTAISRIMNVIISGSKHDFKTLKAGVKYLFERWHLDITSLKTFLDQTRIFRPPCIDISGPLGYSKKAGGVLLFTKPDKPTKKPRGDESCHTKEIVTVNVNND